MHCNDATLLENKSEVRKAAFCECQGGSCRVRGSGWHSCGRSFNTELEIRQKMRLRLNGVYFRKRGFARLSFPKIYSRLLLNTAYFLKTSSGRKARIYILNILRFLKAVVLKRGP